MICFENGRRVLLTTDSNSMTRKGSTTGRNATTDRRSKVEIHRGFKEDQNSATAVSKMRSIKSKDFLKGRLAKKSPINEKESHV